MNLQDKYNKKIKAELMRILNIKNAFAAPKIEKIVINAGLGEALSNKKIIEEALRDISKITGQKPVITKARRSISGFKLRAGQPIGIKVTLRRKRMYDFYEKLVGIVLPRLRDFRGIDASSFDKQGNLSIGFSDYSVFPEMDFQEASRARGLEITIVTSAKKNAEAKVLFEKLGMPFKTENTRKH